MNLGFRSLNVLFVEAWLALQRFPVVLLLGFLCAIVAIVITEGQKNEIFPRVLAILAMGIPLSFAITLFCESDKVSRPAKYAAAMAAVVFLGLLYLSFHWSTKPVYISRSIQLNVAIHLLVAFIIFIPRGSVAGFWLFNERLFVRFLMAVLYSGVIFAGLSAAMAATQYLLGFTIPSKAYMWLWIIIAFIFNTWFFVGRIPRREVTQLGQIDAYPREIKIFTQYVLIPLVTLYCFILYAYLAKILITWSWPKGMVGYLVSSVSLVGIFSLLLVHPVQDLPENKWIKVYSRGFYLALFPLLVLLFLGTWKRISEYGFTEKRYFLLVLDVWIAAMAIYFTLSRKRNIKVIPVTLCLLALLTAAGPWSAYEISKRSQTSRLRANLERAGALVDDKPVKITQAVDYDVRRQISEQFRYLNEMHAPYLANKWFPGMKSTDFDSLSREMAESLGIAYLGRWDSYDKKTFYFSLPYHERSRVTNVAGFDALFQFDASAYGPPKNLEQRFTFTDGQEYTLVIERGTQVLKLRDAQNEVVGELSLVDFVKKVRSSFPAVLTGGEWKLSGEEKQFRLKANISTVRGEEVDDQLVLQSFTAEILLKKK